MKNQFLKIMIGVLVIPLTGWTQEHMNHNMHMEKANTAAVTRYEVNSKFQSQLKEVYALELELNQAFVEGNVVSTKEKALLMIRKLSQEHMDFVLSGDALDMWMKDLGMINEGLEGIMASQNIDEQRKYYVKVNDGLYRAIKTFGVGETVFYNYCPMYKASWLSNNEKIQNPYYGGKMVSCGSTKEIIN